MEGGYDSGLPSRRTTRMTKSLNGDCSSRTAAAPRPAAALGQGGRSLRDAPALRQEGYSHRSLREGGRSLGQGGISLRQGDVEGGRGVRLSPGRDPLDSLLPLRSPSLAQNWARRKHGRFPHQLVRYWQLHHKPLVVVHAPLGVQLVGLVDEVHDLV